MTPDLEGYDPEVLVPPDFDEFWSSTLQRRGPILLSVTPVQTRLRLISTWDVAFAGFGGHPIRAWYSRPSFVEDVTIPAVVEFPGYGRGRGFPHERLMWVSAGYAHLLMDVRGQGGRYGNGGDTPDPGAVPDAPWPVTWGIGSPDTYYYRRLITDAVRAVLAVRALPGVDPSRVAAIGNSQGGGLALAVAGLVPDLAALLVTSPFLCDIHHALSHVETSPYGEVASYLAVRRDLTPAAFDTLSYMEGVTFARRATAPACFGTGLRDNVCPPTGAYAAFNAYGGPRTPKEIHAYPFNGHEAGDAFHAAHQLEWLLTQLPPDPA
ncbi:acetylxylan esterase [Catenuloplanes sp. NPDC051500]|uniref:acetylxylan esterase n=1 Tax=Catenuloplanes sp. NPDC051500 TaxID=3363959 RepID=UPI003788BC5C